MRRDNDALISALAKLLDRERKALVAGDFDTLVGQLERKQELFNALNSFPDNGPNPGLDTLKSEVERNQVLLNHALEGIRSVTSRMSALHHIRNSLDTYDKTGRRTTIEGARNPNLEKRA
ncbi:flagellar biosynthesis protein FlgN [Rhodalgimonas zhirmunskyi]|uniref:Flagellar protein FlgN n=1 Tax=Rhodalgimonas zhirmunskyi TaxID=2964767 RepID=A0AAJ1X5U9_9RHOB|nr:flagellar biosynthesis protein FlgN [Rhodoalgimonas zhirmunskyi]MDQ2093999.1 flagellar protein FlgN [Rhodoalgimonas zhirmunskyi]